MEDCSVSSRKRKQRASSQFYSIDVLTDGSEGTGSPCLFLSIWSASQLVNNSNNNNDDDDDDDDDRWWEKPPAKARYALSLASDTCSRLATDQRFKLASTKAIFCPNNNSLWGWKALQLALERAGAEQVHVISSHPMVEQIIVNRRDHLCPLVHLCDLSTLPVANGTEREEGNSVSWWQVYQDDNLLVHAKAVVHSQSSTPTWAFLYTIRNEIMDDEVSFLVLPNGSSTSTIIDKDEIHAKRLPVVHGRAIQCDFIVALEPREKTIVPRITTKATTTTTIPIFVVQPQTGICQNLLVRARQQAQEWHQKCPQHFPWTHHDHDDKINTEESDLDNNRAFLRTGTSLCWWGKDKASLDPIKKIIFHHQDRTLKSRDDKDDNRTLPVHESTIGDSSNLASSSNIRVARSTWPDRLQKFLQPPHAYSPPASDDNEIDLDDDDGDDYDDGKNDDARNLGSTNNSPTLPCSLELFCLGTGCAAPSAYRGASAYFLRGTINSDAGKQTWNMILEAGEGVVTQLQRHVSKKEDILGEISLIWVSHAHWDHYGGLVPLLSSIRRHREGTMSKSQQSAPVVFAPSSVIRFCQLVLCQKTNGEWFHGVAHEDRLGLHKALDDWNRANGSRIAFWENVLVDHSCRHSFGCVFGLRVPDKRIFTFAFSGDTRPCQRFVSVCRRRAPNNSIDFLLHEATFDEEEKEMSVKKKHSTIQEAIQVGRDVGANKLLLSHFSQRYDALPEIPTSLRERVGIALDGMRILLV